MLKVVVSVPFSVMSALPSSIPQAAVKSSENVKTTIKKAFIDLIKILRFVLFKCAAAIAIPI